MADKKPYIVDEWNDTESDVAFAPDTFDTPDI